MKTKFQKKKDREKKVKKKILWKREQVRQENKRKTEEENRLELEHELKNGKPMPFVSPEKKEEYQKKKDEAIKVRLEKNLEILKALEEQYEKEIEAKKMLNKKLEEENNNLKEKIK